MGNLEYRIGTPIADNNVRKIRVLYLQSHTKSFAGVEHVVDLICSKISERYRDNFEIDVLYTSKHANRPKEIRYYTEIEAIASTRLELLKVCRQVIRKKDYDLVVIPQIEPTVIAMIAAIGLRRNFVVYLHGNPHRERSHIKAKILFSLMRAVYIKRIAYVFGTSPKQLDAFQKMFTSQVGQAWLPNPVRRFDVSHSKPSTEKDFVTFINVGRFAYQKGQDLLVSAFFELSKTHKNIKLKLVGYGSGEPELRDQIRLLDIEGLVSIENYPDNPAPAFAASDIYVSTSRWEGWSLAICEALRFGLPVISTDCEFGPSDILVDNRLGRLVGEDGGRELVDAMAYYADNLSLEAGYANYRMDYVDRFDVDRVVEVHARALVAAAGRDAGERLIPTLAK